MLDHIGLNVSYYEASKAFYGRVARAGGRLPRGWPRCGWARQRRSGLRPQYHPGYYGAFVLDPDGNNVEAVCHRPT
jgi:catechol 2,3-dioxygenase-like lactoylglutathione lyase family enzyme